MTLYWIFLTCAVLAGTVFVVQFLLAVAGIGIDADLPDDLPDDIPAGSDIHGSSWLFGVISFKTVITALTFFGLAGLGSLQSGLGDPISLMIGLVFGLAAMYTVHWMMQLLIRLQHDGTVQIENAIGETATVYIPIPANGSGVGKVQLRVQDQIVEYAAQTSAPEKLATGTPVQVTDVVSPTIVQVEPLADRKTSSHQPAEPEPTAQLS